VRTAPVQTPFFAPCRHGKPAWQRRRLLPMPGARLTSHTTGWQAQRILVAPKRPRRRYADVKSYRIAILLRGDREGRRAATPHNNRFYRVFEELAALGIDVEPAVYDEAIADEVRRQLLAVDGCSYGSIRSTAGKAGPSSMCCCATWRCADPGSARIPT